MILSGSRFAEAVEFADPTLEAAIRAKIAKGEGPIAAADLLSILELELISGAIADLSGIEALENLEVLVLVDQHLVDIAPLAGLKKLRALDLASNQIVDIAPLSSLSALTFLSLAFNNVSDLSPLSSLDQLQVLLLDENRVADISPLLELSMLEQVLLRGNPLNAETLDVHIPSLIEQGVEVLYNLPEDSAAIFDESGVRLPFWQPIGPVVEPWQPGVYSLAVSPHDPERLYALAQNGLWRSQDGGRQWKKMSLMAKSYGHGSRVDALLVDRLAPSTLYVEDGSIGDPDILKSDDGGLSWQLIASPSAEPCTGTGGSGLSPNILLASDLQRPDRLYSVSCGALALSDDGGQSWYEPQHSNGGLVRVEGSSPFFLQHPRNEHILYAGFFHRGISTFLARSDDGGDTWRDRNTIELPLRAMAVDPENEQALFAISPDTLYNSLYNSLDGGLSWQAVAELPIDAARGLVIHPLDATRMIVWDRSTWQSTDAGQSWERLPIDFVAQLEIDPLQAETLWAVTLSTLGSIHHSADWGRTWSKIALIDPTRMAESLLITDDRSLWVGSGQWQDGLFEPSLLIGRDQGARWNELLREVNNPGLDTSFGFSSPIGFGPIDRLLIDANDPNLIWAHTRYWFMQSRDAGASWTLFAPGLEQGRYGQSVDSQPHIMQKTAGEGAHFLVDPMSPSKNLYRSRDQGQTWQFVQQRVSAAMVHGTSLYASVGPRLWHSDNEGDDWQRIANLPGSSGAYALAVHPRTQDFYMANDLGLLRSSDGGVSWTTLRERGNESWLSVKIRFDPANDDAIYLITGRQLLETTDGGETWVSIGRSLGPMPWFNEVAIDPHHPSLRYVATPHGVFVAGKESSTAIVETQTALPEHFSLGQNAPNPFNGSTTIPYEIAIGAAAELAIYNVVGQRVRTFVLGYQSPGEYRVAWDGRDDGGRKLGSGVYLYALKSGAEAAWRKAILVK
ncbi:MAG: hypothetical protein OXN90_18005 [Gemmatimonadota bacterium]|nr:hypothetical protein [Gemmatimonadota bacterium]